MGQASAATPERTMRSHTGSGDGDGLRRSRVLHIVQQRTFSIRRLGAEPRRANHFGASDCAHRSRGKPVTSAAWHMTSGTQIY